MDIKPTPSIALGAYEVTPLEIAGAYTVFPNGGDLMKPSFIKTIRDQQGSVDLSRPAGAETGASIRAWPTWW